MYDEKRGSVEVNDTLNESYLYIIRKDNASNFEPWADTWHGRKRYEFTKYQIKESDMRIKTATFTSPHYFDLSTGQFHCLIVSPYHENFSGILLKVEYDADSDMYNYQCQDMSRWFMNKGGGYRPTIVRSKTTEESGQEKIEYKVTDEAKSKWSTYYELICTYAAHALDVKTAAGMNKYRKRLSGIRPIAYYDYKFSGGVLSGNPMERKCGMLIQDQTEIDIIRTLCFSAGMNVDVYVNKHGVLQIVPTMDNGDMADEIHIEKEQLSSLKMTFDETNIATGVSVAGTDKLEDPGKIYSSDELIGFHLDAIFGVVGTSISNPNKTSASKVSSTSSSSTSTNKNGNPFNSKAKKAYVDADSGSGSFKSSFISELKKNGWTVKDGGTGPGTHYNDYFNVTSDYSVLVNIYNGFCAGTIREAYSSTIQNKLKNKGVQLVIVFDTAGWTNPNGMKPYRYGDFSGYSASRAWDDNFSSSNPGISNVGDYFKKNNAVYCAYPSVSGAIEQFNAGGYFKWKK